MTLHGLYSLLFEARRCLGLNLIQKHFNDDNLEKMLRSLDNTKVTYKNGAKVSLIKDGLRDLRNEIRKMSKSEIESKTPDMIVKIVEKILDVNKQN